MITGPDTSTVGMASDSKDYFSSPQNPPGVSKLLIMKQKHILVITI